jgi:alkylation response protein AidB-like acyl-CoA dehydrogenase
MADSLSSAVRFDAVECGEACAVGEPDHYTTRWGFWAGAIGVAACWYGGAAGIHRSLRAWLSARPTPTRPAQAAQLGAVAARCASLARELAEAGAAIDADPTDRSGRLRGRALAVRHVVYEGCLEVLDRAARAGRTSYLTGDRSVARRMADLPVYLCQHHPDEDVEELGRDDGLRREQP